MAWHSLTDANSGTGYLTITTSGTPVQVSSTTYPCQTIMFQQVESNTGKLYICDRATANTTTGVGVLVVIPAPTLSGATAVVLPYATVTIPSAPAALNTMSYWVDADNDGEKCLVSIVRN